MAARDDQAGGNVDAQRKADRLGARCDMLRIALDDEQKRFERLQSEAGGMMTFLKEYVACRKTRG